MTAFIRPSSAETETVEALKQQLAETEPALTYQFTDTAVLRFLRGRKGDVEKAYRAMLRYVEWREENKVDEITADGIQAEIDSGRYVILM